jgi:hypothetical protein
LVSVLIQEPDFKRHIIAEALIESVGRKDFDFKVAVFELFQCEPGLQRYRRLSLNKSLLAFPGLWPNSAGTR